MYCITTTVHVRFVFCRKLTKQVADIKRTGMHVKQEIIAKNLRSKNMTHSYLRSNITACFCLLLYSHSPISVSSPYKSHASYLEHLHMVKTKFIEGLWGSNSEEIFTNPSHIFDYRLCYVHILKCGVNNIRNLKVANKSISLTFSIVRIHVY